MKVLAFNLPQYHRIPQNDAWWGEGFTEWTNTRKAVPLFAGHRQPRTPENNNYYDLTDPETHAWQARLAADHGIHGFCYYHYWFGGQKLLERPAETILSSGKPDFPFCFAWANEPWTRSWDGLESQVLMPQTYGNEENWLEHYNYLRNFFLDSRYIKSSGAPVFLIYRARSIPNVEAMMIYMNTCAKSDGLPGIHFVQMLTSFDGDPIGEPFSKCVYFEPMYTMSNNFPVLSRIIKGLRIWVRDRFLATNIKAVSFFHNRVSYSLIWNQILSKKVDSGIYPGAFVDWDNSARKGAKAMTCDGVSPELFGANFHKQLKRHKDFGHEFLFMNAWNEWAEGAYLEPDTYNGHKFLDQVKIAIEKK